MQLNQKSHLSSALYLVCAVLVAGFLFSSAVDASPTEKGKFSVVKMIDHQGALQYEIVESDVVKFLKKELDDGFKAAKKEWTAAKKAWQAEHGGNAKFTMPAPIKPFFKEVAKGIDSMSKAGIEKETAKSKGPFCVVQIIRGSKKNLPEIIQKDEVNQIKFSLSMEHFELIKEWVEEKEAFEKSNPDQEFAKACPDTPQVKVLKNGLKTMEKANAYLSKYKK